MSAEYDFSRGDGVRSVSIRAAGLTGLISLTEHSSEFRQLSTTQCHRHRISFANSFEEPSNIRSYCLWKRCSEAINLPVPEYRGTILCFVKDMYINRQHISRRVLYSRANLCPVKLEYTGCGKRSHRVNMKVPETAHTRKSAWHSSATNVASS